MGSRPARAKRGADGEESELTQVTVALPQWSVEDLRRRGQQRSMTVTEMVRRAVTLEAVLSEDPNQELVPRDGRTGVETVLRFL
jgi:hypothetical protein